MRLPFAERTREYDDDDYDDDDSQEPSSLIHVPVPRLFSLSRNEFVSFPANVSQRGRTLSERGNRARVYIQVRREDVGMARGREVEEFRASFIFVRVAVRAR